MMIPPPTAKKIERLKSEYDVAGQVYEYLNTQGMSDIVIAGILGNMMTECGGQTLDLQWDIYGYDGSYYYGLCQWSLYYNPSVDGADITGQLDYLMSNIRTNMDYFGGDYDEFCAIADPGDAAKYFCSYYERGAGKSTRATNAETAFKWIEAGSIDMILCDLPYGATQNKWDVVISPNLLWQQYERIIKPNGAILLFGQDKFTATMMLSNPKLHRYNIIWDKVLKSGFLNAKKMPLREHEDIMVFYKSPPTYNPQMEKGKKNHSKGKAVGKQVEDIHSNRSYGNYICVQSEDTDMKYPASIWRFPKPHPSVALHSTEKPIELLRYAIRTYTLQGEVVLDNCCGTGSTLIAAKLEGRHYIGIDNGVCDKKKSPYYGVPWAEVAQRRLEEINGSKYESA